MDGGQVLSFTDVACSQTRGHGSRQPPRLLRRRPALTGRTYSPPCRRSLQETRVNDHKCAVSSSLSLRIRLLITIEWRFRVSEGVQLGTPHRRTSLPLIPGSRARLSLAHRYLYEGAFVSFVATRLVRLTRSEPRIPIHPYSLVLFGCSMHSSITALCNRSRGFRLREGIRTLCSE